MTDTKIELFLRDIRPGRMRFWERILHHQRDRYPLTVAPFVHDTDVRYAPEIHTVHARERYL